MSLATLIVTSFGLGRIPFAPGTFGSLGGLLFWALIWITFSHPLVYWTILLVLCVFSVRMIQIYESRTQQEDPSEIVVDEWIGVGIALGFVELSWMSLVLAFVLFRLFDITKPPGVRFFDRRHLNSWGTMLDDVVAGLYAGLILLGLSYYGFI